MEAVKKRITYRQLNIKRHRSNSWFIALSTGVLQDLQDSPSKEKFKRTVNKQVNSYWTTRISGSVMLLLVCVIYMLVNFAMVEDILLYGLLVMLERFRE